MIYFKILPVVLIAGTVIAVATAVLDVIPDNPQARAASLVPGTSAAMNGIAAHPMVRGIQLD
jgi:uncharacterized membrane protein YozB (DUF420 family)